MRIISKDITLTVDGSPQSFRLTKPDTAVRGVPDPAVTESLVMNIAGQVLTFLGLIGVILDPATVGVGDSERTLGYEEPREDK